MSTTRKPEPLKIYSMLAREQEHSLGQGVEGQCPKCNTWQALLLSVDDAAPLKDGEYRLRRDDTLYPIVVCPKCSWEGRVKLR